MARKLSKQDRLTLELIKGTLIILILSSYIVSIIFTSMPILVAMLIGMTVTIVIIELVIYSVL